MSNISIEKKHILVAGNEPQNLAELKMELVDSFDISIAATGSTALMALENYNIEAAVIHVGENRENSFSMFAEISEPVNSKHIPVLFLTENDSANDEADAFAAGAVDYTVRKPSGANALISRINLRILAGENERRIARDAYRLPATATGAEAVLVDKIILVVDDIELNRELIEGMLFEIDGLALDFAGDGKEAVRKFSEAPDRYSLILMDVQMPVMDGIDATRAIRNVAYKNAREIPIIALTADVEEADVASYLAAGMNDFLKKPMDFSLLLNMVSKYCDYLTPQM